MSTTTALTESRAGRLGVMVRTGNQLFVYWRAAAEGPRVLRITDLSGRAPDESLDGVGFREVALAGGAQSVYVDRLIAGHLYGVALCAEGGAVLLAAGPVQTPPVPAIDTSTFPVPYHRS
jgi:hypothetical protein